LLVSVRDAAEAAAALRGGADVIDVKEPSRGPLGRADAATIAAIVRIVGGRVPVSAARGELRDRRPEVADLPAELRYVKWGLARLSGENWQRRLSDVRPVGVCQIVSVAYADYCQADAPSPAEVAEFVVASDRWPVLLIDTFDKNGSTLLDWLSVEKITSMVRTCRDAGVQVALAGSLRTETIVRLRDVRPDWFAVRGAACDGGRGGTVAEARVRALADLVHSL
jgi:hypothetical protein